jgi:hypothetical protein
MNTQEMNEPSDSNPLSDQWLLNYKFYLIAAVVLSVIGFAMTTFHRFDFFSHSRDDYSLMLRFVALPIFASIVQIGLFAFAISSLSKIGEAWVRTFHLSINALAIVMCLASLLILFGGIDKVWEWVVTSALLQIGGATVFPISEIFPWQYLWSTFPNSGNESHPVMLVVRFAASAIPLALAAYWWDRWNRSTDLSSADIPNGVGRQSLGDSSNLPSVGNWVVTLVIISIPVVNLAALLWWSFGSQTPTHKVNFAKAALIMLAIHILIYGFFIIQLVPGILQGLSRGYY